MQRIASTARMLTTIGVTVLPTAAARPLIRYFSDASNSTLYELYSELSPSYLQSIASAITDGQYGINPNVTINALAEFEKIFHIKDISLELSRLVGNVANETLESELKALLTKAVDQFTADQTKNLGLSLGVSIALSTVALTLVVAGLVIFLRKKSCVASLDDDIANAMVPPNPQAEANEEAISEEEMTAEDGRDNEFTPRR